MLDHAAIFGLQFLLSLIVYSLIALKKDRPLGLASSGAPFYEHTLTLK